MKENQSYFEQRYSEMSPREQNVEMMRIFDFLPDFDATFRPHQNMNLLEKQAEYERINELIDQRVNSQLKKDLFVRLKSLLSFSFVTGSFQLDILDKFDKDFDEGITSSSTIVGDKIFSSGAEFYSRLFHWDNPEDGGIFGKNAKEIDRKAYKNAVWFSLSSMRIAEKMGLSQEEIEKMRKEAEEEGQFLEIAKQFESDEGLRKLEAKRKANDNLKKALGEDQKRIERVRQWKIEFEKLYGEEP
jgi:hypothetical protein